MEDKKKQIIKISVFITSIFVILLSISYAFINLTLQGEKKQVITAGNLSLELKEDENVIDISDALPMYDEVGMLQTPFTFRIINNVSTPTNYILKLVDITTGDKLDTGIVKYGLTKDGITTKALLSTLTDGVIDSGTVGTSNIEYELRLWIDSSITDNTSIKDKSLSYKLELTTKQVTETITQKVTFAGITKEVSESTETMFNYSSEGCIMDMTTGETSCPVEATNGIYTMEDDDGPSYFYRGDVDNLVKFGTYTKDYYVYRYNSYDFVSLEACQYAYKECTEDNKVLKYAASDNVPMYWRIVRVNGDGTIRMIYAGTEVDAQGQDLGIGISRYNEEYTDPKYTGYTYDRDTTEVDSDAKTEIDAWYNTNIEGTTYDDYIVEGKFCSDSSDYGEVTFMEVITTNAFGPFKRTSPFMLGLEGNVNPIFKCPETDKTYGGSYTLKVGLVTLDEIVAAGGGEEVTNETNYLYDTNGFYTLSPSVFGSGGAAVGMGAKGYASAMDVEFPTGPTLRPVINLRADIVFKAGTDGSTTSPYEIQ